jgi:TPR repeat protein
MKPKRANMAYDDRSWSYFQTNSLRMTARCLSAFCTAIFLLFLAQNPALAKDRDIPRAEEGYADSALVDGKQNYPFELYGVSRDWNAQCRKGNAAQCIRLAKAFEEGLGALAKDNRVAIGYYLLACEKGSATGCSTSASMLFDGDMGYRNDPLAAKNAQYGCESLNDQHSCAIMGYAQKRGLGMAQNEAGAFAKWNAACASGEDLGCEFKAYSLFNEYDDAASGQQAVALFQTACDKQLAWGCAGLSFVYGKGRGAGKDSAKSFTMAQKACVEGKGDTHLACVQYGDALFDSNQPDNVAKGVKFLFTGCQGGNAYACNKLGQTAVFQRRPGQNTTLREGLHFLRAACDLDYAVACDGLGKAHLDAKGDLDGHPGITFALWEKACKLGHQETCKAWRALGDADAFRATVPPINPALPANVQIAQALAKKKQGDARTAWFTLRDLMYEGNDDAEWLVGSWLYYGVPDLVDVDKASGLIAIQNAASVGQPDAMKWLAYAYWDGTAVAQDRQKAKNYMAYLAVRGDREAEAIWRSMDAEGARQAYARRQVEFAALMERLAKIQARQYAQASAYTSSSSGSSYSSRSSSSYSGATSSGLSDSLARIRSNNDYYAANVSRAQGRSCPIGNSYC